MDIKGDKYYHFLIRAKYTSKSVQCEERLSNNIAKPISIRSLYIQFEMLANRNQSKLYMKMLFRILGRISAGSVLSVKKRRFRENAIRPVYFQCAMSQSLVYIRTEPGQNAGSSRWYIAKIYGVVFDLTGETMMQVICVKFI